MTILTSETGSVSIMPVYNKPLGYISETDTYKILVSSHMKSVLRENRAKIRNCYSISSEAARTNYISFGFISPKIRHGGVGYGAIYIQSKNSKKGRKKTRVSLHKRLIKKGNAMSMKFSRFQVPQP